MTQTKWPARLVIVRHGQSEQNVALDLLEDNLEQKLKEQKEIRDADVELTSYGVFQAQQTGLFLRETDQFDICFSSPYVRTMQTAEVIIENIGYELRIYQDERLREKEFGRLHGFSRDEIKESFPEEFHDRNREGKYYYRLPRGENYPDVRMRIHSFLDKLARDYGGKKVLIVTHQVPCKLFRALFEHLREKEVLALEETPNCGIQEYVTDPTNPNRLKLIEFNRIAYNPTDSSLPS
tara:strand:+ start:212 stop:922 length:711 start_codon:yes stop_codon:yes gene_type:complete